MKVVKNRLNYIKAIIICHGKSEMIFVQSLKSNLKINIVLEGKSNGKESIQITSLINYLDKKGYKNKNTILHKHIDIEHNKNKLINCMIFFIMDLDEPELNSKIISEYKDKTMFKKYDYYDNIIPIYNDKNLDEVLIQMGYDIDQRNKTKSYHKVFPGINGDLLSFQKIKNDFSMNHCSNMVLLLEYLEKCIDNNNT